MSRAANALMRLYENADLRDELTDDEADQMLKWAEAELARIDAASADDASFETQADTLMDLLKKMNRFAGRQGQISAQGVDPAPSNIAGLATELGHAASAEQIAAAGTGDPASTITALTALMSAAAQPATPVESTAQAAAQAAPASSEAPDLTAPTDSHNIASPSQPEAPPTASSTAPLGDPFDDIDL